MTITAFRPESFRSTTPALPALTMNDLAEARKEGFAEGHKTAMAGVQSGLLGQVRTLSDKIAETDMAISQARVETIKSIAPLLHVIIDQCVRTNMASKLANAVASELEKLSQETTKGKILLTCDAQTADWLSQHVEGVDDHLTVTEADTFSADLQLPGGRVSFDTTEVIASMKDLINSLSEDLT